MGAERGCGHHRGLTRPYCWLHGWRSLRRGRASSGQPDAGHRRGNIARLSDLWRCAACGRGVPKRLRNRGAGRRARSRLLRFGAGARVPMAGLGGSPSNGHYRSGSFDYYVSEPIVSNDLKGVGPFILAGIEVQQLTRTKIQ